MVPTWFSLAGRGSGVSGGALGNHRHAGRVVCVYLSLELPPDAFNETDCFSME